MRATASTRRPRTSPPDNASELALAWTWQTVDRPVPEYNVRPGGFETTPIMIDDVLYASTSFHQVVALNANTGEQLWVFDPRTYEEGPPLSGTGLNSRGVAFWRGDDGEARIFIAGRQRLFAIDAKSGKPVATFGASGAAALNVNLGRDVPRLHTQVTSPPVVYRNLVIIGTGVPDRLQYRGDPPGTVQAFDVRTGSRVWVFFTIPQSATDFGADTWGNDSWKIAGHANVWAPMSLDEARGLLYLPTSTPSGDYWGGWRPGANLFAESIVCLDALTGQRRWHFQAIHHGLWDYDFASAPTLATSTANGTRVDVVAQVSKQGFTYVFDRVTGAADLAHRGAAGRHDHRRPWRARVSDAAVSDAPASARPAGHFPRRRQRSHAGDQASRRGAAQTLPSRAALHAAQPRRARSSGRRRTARRTGAAPPSIPKPDWLFVKAVDSYHVSTLCRNDQQDPYVAWEYSNYCGQYGLFSSRAPQGPATPAPPGSPVPGRAPDTVNYSGPALGGIPLTKPPYAYLVAIDLNKGEIAWKVPFGEGSQAIRQHPLLKGVTLPERLGTAGSQGPIVTRGGVVLIGGGEPYLYAFDKATGREIARVATPFRTSGNPMTYRTRAGRQFVVIATGAGDDGTLAAFALKMDRP